MTKLQKVEGKEEICPSNGCGCKIICRMTKPKEGSAFAAKLQWQNPDGTAHYMTKDGTNFTCNKPDGKEAPVEKTSSSGNKAEMMNTSQKMLEFIKNYEFKELKTEKEQEIVTNKARKFFEEQLLVAKVAIEEFSAVGYDNPASIGQKVGFLNQ